MNDSGPLASMFEKPEEGFDFYAPENVSPLVAWLASGEASQVSGFVLVVYGKEITLVGKPTLGPSFESPEAWTVSSVAEKLGAWFEGKRPIADGFTVVP